MSLKIRILYNGDGNEDGAPGARSVRVCVQGEAVSPQRLVMDTGTRQAGGQHGKRKGGSGERQTNLYKKNKEGQKKTKPGIKYGKNVIRRLKAKIECSRTYISE